MEHIETVTVGSGGAASIEFTSIPQDGTDLVIKTNTRSSQATTVTFLKSQLNGDTGANYDWLYLRGTGSSAQTSSSSGDTDIRWGHLPGANATANTFDNSELYIANYTGSTNKSISADSTSEDNATLGIQNISACLYNDTTAITSVKLFSSSNLVEGSTASLYIVTAGGDGTVTTS